MSSYKFSNKKPSVKELLEGATFRKTFTPKQPAPPPPPPPSAKVNPAATTSSSRGEVTNDKKIFNRLCDLFGKDVSSMNQVIEFQSDPPAKAAAEVLGYSYQIPAPPVADVQMVVNHNKKLMKAIVEEDDQQAEMKDRLMKEIKQKISERRRRILQQRRDLFNDSTVSSSSADVVVVEEEVKEEEEETVDDDRDLWKAVPALADPDDADSSFEEEERGRWDPDAAFSEVERILESLESNAALNEELVGRFRLTDHVHHRREQDCGRPSGGDVIVSNGDEDKNSDDSGMSSSADSSTVSSSSSSSSSSRQEVSAVVKPVRKSKQQVVATISTNDDHQISSASTPSDEEMLRNQLQLLNSSMHIYSVAHDSPVIIDSISVNLDDDDASIRGGTSSEHRIRLDLSSLAPTPTPSLSSITTFGGDGTGGGRRRSGTSSNLTNSAGEIFGSLRSNLSAGAYSTGEALNRIAQHVTDNIVRPIADTMGEAGDGLVRAAEPLVQHLQLLSTRLQVRYRHAAQHKQWLPQLREAADWIEDIPKSQNGFEELRLHVKEGGDLCKELSAILQERSELEASYAKGLAKLASKLLKTTGELQGPHGTVTAGWSAVAMKMESEAELHKSLSVALSEELVKPLKVAVESQHRVRKAVESGVDKTGRMLAEWRSAQAKAKKHCYMSARENEKMQDQVFINKPRVLTDKETAKLEAKCKKTQEAVRKAEGEYYTCCTKAERSRLEWESTTQRGGRCFHALEQERLEQLKDLLSKYYVCFRDYCPKMCQAVDRLVEPVSTCNIDIDLQSVSSLRDSAPTFAEQLLPDFYAEHMSNVMNRERRKDSLERCLHWVRSDLERESRGRRGVENLAKALQESPHFGGEESQLEVHEKLLHLRSMLAFLEMTRVKLHNSAHELEPIRYRKVDHPLFKYLSVHKDKQGMMQSVLKLPHWIDNEDIEIEINEDGRGTGDGNSGQVDSDFDEFSSQGSDGEISSHSVIQRNGGVSSNAGSTSSSSTTDNTTVIVPSVGKCRALYSYAANMYDELSIQPGDVINIHDKQADGWWLGELSGTVGIFPATYVEEV
ncbi:uncharacterized protein LOC124202314 [Daphnia pulex]|uniref:uncharacterized protein LOC124202314 n=1 Tax=Daphnia pulex TaxID=6669 RepID=UPI001EDF5920|nr:uncharacterized protein LOC124202314 [Daphnia pulex]XP_046454603.1 uncharacterized protein LOC124202314 [Daphnia pulex]